ncbi:MAG: hypothetical protein IPP40_07455 [bacterium]|nr:hypothetical protein [bacterium]
MFRLVYSVIGGGFQNLTLGYAGFVGGGIQNRAEGDFSTVSGGGSDEDFWRRKWEPRNWAGIYNRRWRCEPRA